jgi:hypothetical protein
MDWSDLTADILDAGIRVFGRDVLYTPLVGSPATVRGVFDKPTQNVPFGLAVDPLVLASLKPRLGVKLADLPSDQAVVGDTVGPIDGVTYTVAEVEKDGQGGASLVLEEAP